MRITTKVIWILKFQKQTCKNVLPQLLAFSLCQRGIFTFGLTSPKLQKQRTNHTSILSHLSGKWGPSIPLMLPRSQRPSSPQIQFRWWQPRAPPMLPRARFPGYEGILGWGSSGNPYLEAYSMSYFCHRSWGKSGVGCSWFPLPNLMLNVCKRKSKKF